jgi:DNA modification methylase
MVLIRIVFGDAQNMSELPNSGVHLVAASPPYFNAPYDCIGYEIDLDLKDVIIERLKPVLNTLSGKAELQIVERSDAKHIRSRIDEGTRGMIEEMLEAMGKFSTR